MAQGTKVNPREIQNTKVDIVSFVIPKFRNSVSANNLIYSLQSSRLDESAFLLVLREPCLTPTTLDLPHAPTAHSPPPTASCRSSEPMTAADVEPTSQPQFPMHDTSVLTLHHTPLRPAETGMSSHPRTHGWCLVAGGGRGTAPPQHEASMYPTRNFLLAKNILSVTVTAS